MTVGCPGMPRWLRRMSASRVKADVTTVTDGTPLFSVSIPSWRPHAVQDPQSATAWTTASALAEMSSSRLAGAGVLALALRWATTMETP